jgi:hypothetical protein
VFVSKIKLEDLWSVRLNKLPRRIAARAAASERGGEGGGRGGEAWSRVAGAARVLFIGFFSSTRSARGARTKITPVLGQNHA